MLRKAALVACGLLMASCASIGVPQPTPTVAPTLTPSRTAVQTALAEAPTRTPQPTVTETDAPTTTSTLAPSATLTATATPTETHTPSATFTETATETGTQTPTPTPTDTATQTASLTFTPTLTPTDTAPPSNTPLPRFEPTATPTVTPTPSETPTATITPSLSPTPTDTPTPEPTETFTPTNTFTPSATPSPEPSATASATATVSATASATASATSSATASVTSVPFSATPEIEPTVTSTREPFAMTPVNTWTPVNTPTPTVTVDFAPTLDATPVVITLAPDDPTPAAPLPSETVVQGVPTQEVFAATPTTVFPTVEPFEPPPTIEFIPVPVGGTGPVTVGALPFLLRPDFTIGEFVAPGARPSGDYQPFSLARPGYPGQSVMTDEVGRMYWVDGEGNRIGLPAPFTSFGSENLENNDQLVRSAAWSADGSTVAFVVDNPLRADANDGVWWWDVSTGQAYQVMHNCRRHVRDCGTYVNAPDAPYINTPADQPEQPNTGWYAESVSFSPDGTRLLARLRIRDDERLAFMVLPVTADEGFKRVRGPVCHYEFSDWAANGQSVLVAGRNASDTPVIGRIDNPTVCDGYVDLSVQNVIDARVTPIAETAGGGSLPEGVVAGNEIAPGVAAAAGMQLQVTSLTSEGLNLRASPSLSGGFVVFLFNGDYVRLLAGPVEGEGYRWWKVRTAGGSEGWMAGSSAGSQLLVPAP